LEIKALANSDIFRLKEIDRTERIRRIYTYKEGELEQETVIMKVPPWSDEKVDDLINGITPELDKGGILLGALDGRKLAGVAVLGNRSICGDEEMLQMVFLHVSEKYRRRGIAGKLMEEVVGRAKEEGAKRLYISATPSDSAIGFYFSLGSKLAPKVDKELYKKEPEDIHLVLEL
jgi:ribosomal protein S18 acetylase RimI-like enzyme